LPIARQIADALEAAHDRGIVHRDRKPANIKTTADGRINVLDVGLAKIVEPDAGRAAGDAGGLAAVSVSPTLSVHATCAAVVLGTAASMSPEQARGRPVDRCSHIWSFGCVLYELLTGRHAFDGETASDVVAAILRADGQGAALPPAMPSAIGRLLRRCLERIRRSGCHRCACGSGSVRPRPRARGHSKTAWTTWRRRRTRPASSPANRAAHVRLCAHEREEQRVVARRIASRRRQSRRLRRTQRKNH
jgi:serine/threonine protein kinase